MFGERYYKLNVEEQLKQLIVVEGWKRLASCNDAAAIAAAFERIPAKHLHRYLPPREETAYQLDPA